MQRASGFPPTTWHTCRVAVPPHIASLWGRPVALGSLIVLASCGSRLSHAGADSGDSAWRDAAPDADETAACAPRATRCTGNAVQTCGADGGWGAVVACSAT